MEGSRRAKTQRFRGYNKWRGVPDRQRPKCGSDFSIHVVLRGYYEYWVDFAALKQET
jgi:hypothetical protein